MPETPPPALILRFACSHYYTEGKFVNTLQAAEHIDAERICLSLTDGLLDDSPLDKSVIVDRLARVKTVIAKLKRRSIAADLALPSLTDANPNTTSNLLKFLYSSAARAGARTIWIDDAVFPHHCRFDRRRLVSWFNTVRRAIHSRSSHIRLGLIAALPETYTRLNLTPVELAGLLAGDHPPLLALTQPFTHDYQRTDILKAAQTLAAVTTLAEPDLQLFSCLDHRAPSTFHKSVEAVQIQINLNLLFGIRQMMLNCFDLTGTAPGTDDPYLNMHQNHRRLMHKLSQLLPDHPQHQGICVIIPDKPDKTITPLLTNPWPLLLWRLGLPVTFAAPSTITSCDAAFVLTGATPRLFKRRQLEHLFRYGVLLDARAALTLQEMRRTDLIGVAVGEHISSVQTEILSDQSFAAPYYGQRIVISDYLRTSDFHQLSAVNSSARPVTTFERKKRRPDTNGMFVFDDQKENRRCVVLPYSLDNVNFDFMLLPARRRHLQDLFSWLLRRRLCCFVESTADLVPFYIIHPSRRRIILALLNVGFDWAIDARIRFGRLPFAIKRVRELNEQGKIVAYPDLKLTCYQDYHYIQLTSDTSVPPLQMTILLIEG